MSLIPVFEIGLWNAWIFIIPLFAIHVVSLRVLKSRGVEGQPSKIMMIIFLILHFLPIFILLILDIMWLIAGFIVYLIGMFFVIMAIIDFATSPIDKPVTTGIFRFSRNPMYIGGIFIFLGIAIMSASWVYGIIILIWLILMINSIAKEESQCLKKYGKAYSDYMSKTHRWFGFP